MFFLVQVVIANNLLFYKSMVFISVEAMAPIDVTSWFRASSSRFCACSSRIKLDA